MVLVTLKVFFKLIHICFYLFIFIFNVCVGTGENQEEEDVGT